MGAGLAAIGAGIGIGLIGMGVAGAIARHIYWLIGRKKGKYG